MGNAQPPRHASHIENGVVYNTKDSLYICLQIYGKDKLKIGLFRSPGGVYFEVRYFNQTDGFLIYSRQLKQYGEKSSIKFYNKCLEENRFVSPEEAFPKTFSESNYGDEG